MYHIVFYKNETDLMSHGNNYTCDSPEEALSKWRVDNPEGILIYLKIVQ